MLKRIKNRARRSFYKDNEIDFDISSDDDDDKTQIIEARHNDPPNHVTVPITVDYDDGDDEEPSEHLAHCKQQSSTRQFSSLNNALWYFYIKYNVSIAAMTFLLCILKMC